MSKEIAVDEIGRFCCLTSQDIVSQATIFLQAHKLARLNRLVWDRMRNEKIKLYKLTLKEITVNQMR